MNPQSIASTTWPVVNHSSGHGSDDGSKYENSHCMALTSDGVVSTVWWLNACLLGSSSLVHRLMAQSMRIQMAWYF